MSIIKHFCILAFCAYGWTSLHFILGNLAWSHDLVWQKIRDPNVVYFHFLWKSRSFLFILGFLRSPYMRMESESLLSLPSLQFLFLKKWHFVLHLWSSQVCSRMFHVWANMLKSSCVILQRPFSCSGDGRNIAVLLLIAMIKRPQHKQFRLERGYFVYKSRVVYIISGKSRQWKHEAACHTHIKSRERSVGMLACAQLSSTF